MHKKTTIIKLKKSHKGYNNKIKKSTSEDYIRKKYSNKSF